MKAFYVVSPALKPSHYIEQTPISLGYCCIITGYCDPLAISNENLSYSIVSLLLILMGIIIFVCKL